jgi:hypothetical protein
VPLCVLLAVSVIGIPLIPVAVMLLVAVVLFGFAVSAAWLGGRMPVGREHRTPVALPLRAHRGSCRLTVAAESRSPRFPRENEHNKAVSCD